MLLAFGYIVYSIKIFIMAEGEIEISERLFGLDKEDRKPTIDEPAKPWREKIINGPKDDGSNVTSNKEVIKILDHTPFHL